MLVVRILNNTNRTPNLRAFCWHEMPQGVVDQIHLIFEAICPPIHERIPLIGNQQEAMNELCNDIYTRFAVKRFERLYVRTS